MIDKLTNVCNDELSSVIRNLRLGSMSLSTSVAKRKDSENKYLLSSSITVFATCWGNTKKKKKKMDMFEKVSLCSDGV